MPDLPLAGLTVVAPGLALGVRTAGGAFQPHHHLAMALAPAAPRQPRALDRRAAAAYLAGEALPGGGPPGLCWIHVGGLPLGWARDVGARTNNLYPKALRRVDLVTDW
jgi:NOL1/NOP2/fmu family ribosome biogenesis protein